MGAKFDVKKSVQKLLVKLRNGEMKDKLAALSDDDLLFVLIEGYLSGGKDVADILKEDIDAMSDTQNIIEKRMLDLEASVINVEADEPVKH